MKDLGVSREQYELCHVQLLHSEELPLEPYVVTKSTAPIKKEVKWMSAEYKGPYINLLRPHVTSPWKVFRLVWISVQATNFVPKSTYIEYVLEFHQDITM